MCISNATMLMVYNNLVQEETYQDYSSPTNHNNAFFAGDELHCLATESDGTTKKAWMETVSVTKTSDIPSLTPVPNEDSVYVILKASGKYFSIKHIMSGEIYPNSDSAESLTASDFSGF